AALVLAVTLLSAGSPPGGAAPGVASPDTPKPVATEKPALTGEPAAEEQAIEVPGDPGKQAAAGKSGAAAGERAEDFAVEDPVAAGAALLRERDRCIEEISSGCLELVDQPDSAGAD